MDKKGIPIILLFLFVVFAIPFLDSSPYTKGKDASGVSTVDYGWLMGRYVGVQYYPVTIASSAEKDYNYYIETANESYLASFYINLNWLLNNSFEKEGMLFFPSNFDYPFYGCKGPWLSAMAQGLTLKDLVYAYRLTGDERYLVEGKKVVSSYELDYAEGGFRYRDPTDNGTWYAEYACGDGPPRVFNGFYFALEGLRLYHNETGDQQALNLYEEGLKELKAHLVELDSGSWTYYDLEGYPSDQDYHKLHVVILENLYKDTSDPLFMEYHKRWRAYNYSEVRFALYLGRNLLRSIPLT